MLRDSNGRFINGHKCICEGRGWFKIGSIGYWKNKQRSEKTKLKISKKQMGIKKGPHSEERKIKISQALRGRKLSEEHKKKISKAFKGKSKLWLRENNHYLWKGKIKNNKCIICSKKIDRNNTLRGAKYCSTICNGIDKRGENAHNWNDGSSRKPYGWEFNPRLKKLILKKYPECKLKNKFTEHSNILCIHHIDYNKENNSENNLITLCNKCNIRVNYRREFWKSYLIKEISYAK